MKLLLVLVGILFILICIWLFIVFIGWCLLPFTLKKQLENISEAIENLKEDKQNDTTRS
ncbi:MAG: hypothetical protein PUJ51_22115 [Clostridiales bacterium]|uniref:hypothetical protein n=1 Tax=Terrisporobacter sp. TaxID=1965305 RepID=UPI002A5944F2|nr:hypothetical protein [Terrisporobacter sp.]MDD7757152.1 hypothetical protein [Clostridiales bacterium]MDY3801816.1 hypothetical protein [Bacilli bacterium]MDY4137668.1 hypothetical protein [Terrisporobacter sp.]